MYKKLLYFFLAVLLVVLQYKLWFSTGGMIEKANIEKQVAIQQDHNLQLEDHNDAMRAEVTDLKKGDEAIEEYARGELGMIKEDEVFYRVVK